MSFLFPAMLAGLAALAVPIAIHLISRHKFPVQDFPSLRLLQREERANVFAPKIVDLLQLLLRHCLGSGRDARTMGRKAAPSELCAL